MSDLLVIQTPDCVSVQTKNGPSADDASMSIDDHVQCEAGDEEDNVKKMISLIGTEVCGQLSMCVGSSSTVDLHCDPHLMLSTTYKPTLPKHTPSLFLPSSSMMYLTSNKKFLTKTG